MFLHLPFHIPCFNINAESAPGQPCSAVRQGVLVATQIDPRIYEPSTIPASLIGTTMESTRITLRARAMRLSLPNTLSMERSQPAFQQGGRP